MSRQLRHIAPVLVAATLLGIAIFSVVGVLHVQDRVPAYLLIDDPAPFADLPWYTGILSYAGVLLWTASAVVCGFTVAILRRVESPGGNEVYRFLFILSLTNVWMALDDLLVVHENLSVNLAGFESRHRGEALIFGIYIVMIAFIFFRLRAVIASTDYLLLAVAAASLGLSVAIDIGMQLDIGRNNVFRQTVLSRSWGAPVVDIAEELLKLNGILLWFCYLAILCVHAVDGAMRVAAVDRAPLEPAQPPLIGQRKSDRP